MAPTRRLSSIGENQVTPCFQFRIFNIGGSSKQYFAAAAEQLALLHCWSLSLEEQFYLFWPALLFWAFRLGRIGIIISLAATVSFTLSIVELSTDAQAAFFLIPFRIFEFSIGASIIFIEERIRVSNRIAESVAIAGMLAIAVSYSLFTSTMPFPGFAVLLPSWVPQR